MMRFRSLISGAAMLAAPFAFAEVPDAAKQADVVILGEIHDNPAHHATQVAYIEAITPKAVVFEMLSPAEADAVASDIDALSQAQWTNIEDYRDVVAVSPRVVGAALPRDTVRAAFAEGAADVFGAEADRFGLTTPLPPDEQDLREDGQFAAHCEAMPRDLMSGMVEAQRLRDAALAAAVLRARDSGAATVAVIAGNGHTRKDRGVGTYLPEGVEVVSLGVLEADIGIDPADIASAGLPYDFAWFVPPAEREDPCAVFLKKK